MGKDKDSQEIDLEIDIETARQDDIKKMVLTDVDPQTRRRFKKERRKAWLIVIAEFFLLIAAILALFYIMMGISTVKGNSMYPTLHDRNVVVYQRRVRQFRPGDIIVIRRPSGEDYVKRVVAVAGDTVNIQSGNLYVNGEIREFDGPIGETGRMGSDMKYPVTVGDQQVFVLGDNRENSEDSRLFGNVDIEDIRGRLIVYIGGL